MHFKCCSINVFFIFEPHPKGSLNGEFTREHSKTQYKNDGYNASGNLSTDAGLILVKEFLHLIGDYGIGGYCVRGVIAKHEEVLEKGFIPIGLMSGKTVAKREVYGYFLGNV